ncbi:MAG: hypothetical protein KatS3mg105_3521 [Gemmatales bacterium]|nr:MAG: hypothetical protein KatS3mg105_3521 [Gemmatales bacterium]
MAPKLLIHAVASGKKVARKVTEFLRGVKFVEQAEVTHSEIVGYRREKDYEKLKRTPIPVLSPQETMCQSAEDR